MGVSAVSGTAVPLATTNHVQINNYITSSVNVTGTTTATVNNLSVKLDAAATATTPPGGVKKKKKLFTQQQMFTQNKQQQQQLDASAAAAALDAQQMQQLHILQQNQVLQNQLQQQTLYHLQQQQYQQQLGVCDVIMFIQQPYYVVKCEGYFIRIGVWVHVVVADAL